MSDSDVVQESDADVVQPPPPLCEPRGQHVARRRRKSARSHVAVLCTREADEADGEITAKAVLQVCSAVQLPEDAPTEEQVKMRAQVDFQPAFFVEYVIQRRWALDVPPRCA